MKSDVKSDVKPLIENDLTQSLLSSFTTHRGFNGFDGVDLYGEKFSIQKSSLATDDAIWFGIDDPNPQVMASQSYLVGVETTETCGWVEYPIPHQVMINARMHLNKEQVKEIIGILQKFVDTGDVK